MILTAVLRLAVQDVRAVAVAGDTADDMPAGRRAGARLLKQGRLPTESIVWRSILSVRRFRAGARPTLGSGK